MNEKILTADLVNAVAELTAIPKNRCDDFVKAFFEAIANALSIDGVVKVKGLGTFKLIAVEERKSVNVQTGAEMIIPAHSKVSFTPDKVLKDEINKPYAHLKTYVLNPNAPLDPPEVDDDEAVDEALLESGDDSMASVDATGSVAQTVSEIETVSETQNVVESEVPATAGVDVVRDNRSESEVAVAGNVVETAEEPELPSASVDAPAADIVKDNEAAVIQTTDLVVDETKKMETSADAQSSHSDWFDNWEVEYESEGVTEPNKLVQTPQPEKPAEQPVVDVADEVVAALEEDVVDAVKTEETSDAVETEQEIVSAPQVEETVAESSSDVDETSTVANPENNIITPMEESAAETVEEVVGQVLDTDDGVVEVNPVDKPAENDNANVAEEGQFDYSKHNNYDNDDDEVVNRKKVLGVGIIAFLVLLGAAYFGIQKIDPDFFKSLKVSSENPPVMPSDTTTSLAQELSVYVPEEDTVVAASDMVEMAEDTNAVASATENPAEVVEDVPVVKKSGAIDPLWNGEFVAYMKRQHKDVSLETSGLIGETAIKPGLFLTMVALQNYGDKSYWIYLYLYNTDRIKNPNNVPVGTKIRVPNLDKSLVNGPSEEQVNLAKEIRQKFVK